MPDYKLAILRLPVDDSRILELSDFKAKINTICMHGNINHDNKLISICRNSNF